MAAAYTWHPGSDCVNPRWVVPIPLLPDEIVSSWLVRAALEQGCDPLTLTGEVWPKWRIWTLDADRTISNERLTPLSLLSGIPIAAFEAATLQPIASRIWGGLPPRKATWPWVLALGSRNTKRRSGLQYCPSCLVDDAKPYYRLQWRLAWHTGCPKHGCLLRDRCQVCGAPVEPHRLLAEDRHVAVCATCKADLGQASPIPHSSDALALQRLADTVFLQGHGEFNGQTLTTAEWFRLVDFFVSLCRRQNRCGTEGMRGVLNRLGAPLPDGLPVMAGAGIELLLVHEREKLLGCLWRLMDAGGDSLEMALKEAGVTRQGFCNRREPLPMVLTRLVESLPDRPVTRNRKPRQETGAPRSRNQVMRMMAKLRRKLAMARR